MQFLYYTKGLGFGLSGSTTRYWSVFLEGGKTWISLYVHAALPCLFCKLRQEGITDNMFCKSTDRETGLILGVMKIES